MRNVTSKNTHVIVEIIIIIMGVSLLTYGAWGVTHPPAIPKIYVINCPVNGCSWLSTTNDWASSIVGFLLVTIGTLAMIRTIKSPHSLTGAMSHGSANGL